VRRLLASALAVFVVAAAGFGVLLLATPGVGDAAARVAAHTGAEGLLTGPPPLRVQQALVATEDSRFYGHSGVDFLGSARATAGPLPGSPTRAARRWTSSWPNCSTPAAGAASPIASSRSPSP